MNLYAYAASDPVNSRDPLGLLPGIGDLTGHLLPPATPRPSEPQRSAVHPDHHLPPTPAPHPAKHPLPAHPSHPNKRHHPSPAPSAHPCPKSPAPPRRHTPRPAPLPSDTTPIITAADFFGGIWTGGGRFLHFIQGSQDASLAMVNPINILEGAYKHGQHEANIFIPDPDGHVEDGNAYAKSLWDGFLDSINPTNKPTAYATGGAAANAAATLAPFVGEAGALNDLRVGLRAATLSRDTAEAGLKAAETVPEKAAAAAKLRAAEEHLSQVRASLREKIPGVRAVRKVKEAGAKVKQKVSAAKAAAKTAQERRGAGRKPGDPHNARSLNEAQDANAQMKARWAAQTRGPHLESRRLALDGASDGGQTLHSHPLGKPGMSQMAGEGAEGAALGRSRSYKKLNWQEQAKVRAAVKDIHRRVANGQTQINVETDSFEEAHAVLHEAYPNAKRMPGSGIKVLKKTGKQKAAFRRARKEQDGVYYHQDYQMHAPEDVDEDKNSLEGVLHGHEGLPDGHPHKTVKHINVEGWETKPDGTKEYVDVTIYINPIQGGLR